MKQLITFLTILIPNLILSQTFFGYRLFLENPVQNSFETLVAFDTSATTGVDNNIVLFDSDGDSFFVGDAIWPFGNQYLDFHSRIGDQPYIFNYLPFPTEETSVPMWSVANPDTGIFTVGINMYYGNSNTFGFFRDNMTGEFHTSPYQAQAPVTGQRFTLYTTAPVSIETISSCDYNGGQAIIHNRNNIQSSKIYKNGELLLETSDTIITGLESGNYEYRWIHPVGQEQIIDFGISNTSIDVTFQIPFTNVLIFDAYIIPELIIQESQYSEIIWNFGDGTFLYNDVNPVHQYQNPGIYTLIVTILSNTGCVKVFTQEITVIDPTSIEKIKRRNKKYSYTYGIDGKLLKVN